MIEIKRRKYLVNRIFQFRHIGLVMIPLIVLLASLYCLIYYAVFREILIPEVVVATLLPAMKNVNIAIAATAPVLLFFILRAVLIYSNRIIGPICRVERELDKAIAGDYSVRVKARDKDVLYGFIDKINTLLEKIDTSQKEVDVVSS